MEKLVKLQIDGRDVQVPEGTNIIEAANIAGIHIPNLCYIRGMKGIGACRLCLVEVEGMKAPVIACNTKVRDGMVVNTKTEDVVEVRKFVIDLILSMHPLDCMTCTKAGVCKLQSYAYEFGIKESSFTRKRFGYPTDEANPFIKRDPEYCILCGQCVRVCKEQGTSVLDFMGRGIETKVITPNDKPLHESGCTFCGSCIDVCPVNALVEADRWRKGREWEYKKVKTVCLSCGSSCDIIVSTKDGEVIKVNAGAQEGSTERYICAIGRYGFDSLKGEGRITSPAKRIDGKFKETTWDDAIHIVTEKLKVAGPNVGFISTASLLNEDALALRRLADAVRTKNIDTTVSLYADASSIGDTGRDLEEADVIVLVGLAPDQWKRVLPALDVIIRRRVNRGAALIVINSGEPRISSVATVYLKGEEVAILSELSDALKQEIIEPVSKLEEASRVLAKAKNPVILTAPSLYNSCVNIELIVPNLKVVAMPIEGNANGVILMGLVSEGKSYKEMVDKTQSGINVLYAIGELPLKERPNVDFLIIQNSYLTELAKQADVLLPSATALESEGTIVDYLGRLKHLQRATTPAGQSKTHREIFIEIAKALGSPIKEPKEADIRKALKIKGPKPSFSPYKKQDFEINLKEMIESLNLSVINNSRLLWLKETESASS